MNYPSEHTQTSAFAPESEEQLISVLLDGHPDWMPALRRILPEPEAFVDASRRCLWEAMLDLHTRGEVISMDTVTVLLRRTHSGTDAMTAVALHVGRHAIHTQRAAEWHAQQISYAQARRILADIRVTADGADMEPKQMVEAVRANLLRLEHVAYASGEHAPRPLPLAAALPPVEPFDPAWLPEPFQPWISDIAERMQCPPEFPAVAAMAALSSVAGRRFCIQPKARDEGYTEFPHLWAMLIGNPSLMKSPAMQAAMRPLRFLEKEAIQCYSEQEQARHTAEVTAKIRRTALESLARKAVKNNEPFDYTTLTAPQEDAPPALRRFIVNDASIEALGEVLRENPTGTLLYQDELAGLLALLEKDGNQSLRAFLLQAWSGKEGFTFDRIGRGRRHVEHCVISLLGSIQPGVIAAHVRAANGYSAGADGFLQRFSLMVWPDVNPLWEDVDRPLDAQAAWAAEDVFQAFENMTPQQLIQRGAKMGMEGTPTFRFEDVAQECFGEWRHTLESRLRNGGLPAAFEAHLGKYRKLVPAMALLIHMAESLGATPTVPLSALQRALNWADCLESHARRVFASGSTAESDAVQTLLKKLCDGTAGLPAEFRARDIRRKCWAGLAHQEDVESACELLTEHRWLIASGQSAGFKGGRPTMTYHLNPHAKRALQAA